MSARNAVAAQTTVPGRPTQETPPLPGLELLAECSPDIILFVDPDGRVKYCNQASWGMAQGDCLGLSIDEIFPGFEAPVFDADPRTQRIRRKQIARGRIFALTMQAVDPPGSMYVHATDITEYRHMGEQFRENELRYRALVEDTLDVIFSFTPDGTLTYVGPQISRYGYAPKEVIGRSMWEFVHPEDRQRIENDLQQTFASGEDHPSEYRLLGKDGSAHWVESISRVVQVDGEIVRLTGVIRDTSERRLAEAALKESESRYRTLYESTADAIMLFDGAMCASCNGAAVRMFGYSSPDDLLGRHPIEFFPPTQPSGEPSAVIAEQPALTAFQQGSNRFEWMFLRKDGRIFPGDVYLTAMMVGGKQILQVVIRDITERKQAEENLRRSEERFQQVAESAGEWIWEVDADGLYTYVSPGVERMLGYMPEEIVGKKHFYDFFAPEVKEALKKAALEAFGRKESFRGFPNPNLHRDGHEVIMETSGVPILGEQGQLLGYRGADADVTERKRAEEALRQGEAKYRALIETTGTGFVIIDQTGKVIDANPEYVRLAGYRDLSEIYGRSVVDWTADYEKEKNARAVEKCLREGYIKHLEIDYVDTNGTTTPIEINATVVETDGALRILTLCRNITERKQAELIRTKFLERQERLNRLQQALLAPGQLIQKLKMITDGVVDIFGADFCRIWCIGPGDLCERGCMHVADDEGVHICRERDKCLRLMSSSGRYTHTDGAVHRRVPFGTYKIGLVASGQEHKFLTYDVTRDPRVHNHDWARELGLVSFAGYQLRPPDGETLGVLALFSTRAITPEEDTQLDALSSTTAQVIRAAKTSESLLRSETKFRTLYDSTGDAVMLLDEKGFFDCNKASLAMFGCATREEFCSKHPADMSPPQQPCGTDSLTLANQRIATAMEAGGSRFEWMHKRADTGETFPADVLLNALELDDKPVVQAVVRNITERKQAELIRTKFLERQERLNRLQQALLAPGQLIQKLKMITDGVVDIFGADFCRIWCIGPGDLCERGCMHVADDEGVHICRERDKCLRLISSSGRYTHTDGAVHRRVPFGTYKIGLVASRQEHKFLTNDVTRDPRVHNHGWARELGLVSFAGYQLRPPDGETLGVLALFSTRAITPEEDAQLDALSSATAQVIRAAQTEESLRESEERYRIIADQTGQLVYDYDIATGLIRWSGAITALTGYSSEEFQQINLEAWKELVHPDDCERMVRLLDEAMAAGSLYHAEYRMRRKDGAYRHFEDNGVFLRNQDGQAHRMLGTMKDISERKAAEVELRRQKDLLDNVLTTIPYSVFWKDNDCVYLGCNRRLAREAGLNSPEEIVGKTDFELSWRERAELYRADDRQVMQSGIPKTNYAEPLAQPDGSPVWIETSKVPLRDGDGKTSGILGIYTDITKRKQAEEKLLEFKTAVEQSADGIALADLHGHIRFANVAWARMHGYSVDELIGQHLRIFHTSEQLEMEVNPFNKRLLETGSGEDELGHVRRDGTTFRTWMSTTVLTGADQKPFGLLGIANDITERKRMEERLRHQLAIEEAVAAASRMFAVPEGQEVDLAAVLASLGRAIGVQRAFVDHFSDDLEKMSRVSEWCSDPNFRQAGRFQDIETSFVPWCQQQLRNGKDILVPDVELLPVQAARDRELMEQVGTRALLAVPIHAQLGRLAGQLGFTDVETPRAWTEEDARAIRIVADMIGHYWVRRYVEEEHGKLMELLVDSNDRLEVEIVEREKTQQVLRQTVDQYTALINAVPAAMYIKDVEGRYFVVNDTFCTFTGCSAEQLMGKTDHEINSPVPAEEMARLDRIVMEERRGITEEKQSITPDGERRSLMITKVPLVDGSGEIIGIVGMMQDITDRQREREQLLQSEKLAAIGTLAAGVAHEINNPIGYINSNLNTMNRYFEKLRAYLDTVSPPDAKERQKINDMLADAKDAITESIEGTDRVRRIVTDLKSFSRVDRAEKEHANINEGITSTLNVVWNELKYKCTVEKEFGELPDLFCMPNQLNQVFMNLLVNASHAITGQSGLIKIKTWADDGNIYVSIKDNGCGIPEQNIKKIFEPFFTTKDVGKGTGLGLSLSYDIVQRHKGHIEVNSTVGVGTEFVITLPQEGMEDA